MLKLNHVIVSVNVKEVIKPSKVNPFNYVSVIGVVLVVIIVFFEICYNGIDKMYRRGS